MMVVISCNNIGLQEVFSEKVYDFRIEVTGGDEKDYNDVVGKMEEDEMEEQNNFGMGGGGMIDMLRNEEQT